MYSARYYKLIAVDEEGQEISRTDLQEVDLTHNGEVMAITYPMIPTEMVDADIKEYDAYRTAREMHDKYICISYDDAMNIVDMLNEAIEKLGPKDESFGDDIVVFGEKAISYERLVDRLNGLCYPVWKYNKKNKEEKEDA